MGGQDEAVVKAGADPRGAFPRGVRSSFPVRTLPGKGPPAVFFYRSGAGRIHESEQPVSPEGCGENKFLDTLNGIVVLICIITPRHIFMTQEEQ